MIKFKETSNKLFNGKKLDLDGITPKVCETNVVYRPKDTFFNYCAWPSVCRDENGTLYALSAAFGSEHVCPFNKVAMYISKNNGKTWSPPIVVVDTYLPDGHGGITYLGNGKMVLNWWYETGDIMFNENYYRIGMGFPRSMAAVRQAMVDTYVDIPKEKLVGGGFVKVSEDYGMTWSEPVRMPIANIHGMCVNKDGDVVFLGKEIYADTSKTFEEGIFDPEKRPTYESWWDFVARRNERRMYEEHYNTPIYTCISKDGGYNWEKGGVCKLPDGLQWDKVFEPNAVTLDDGTLLGAIRVEDENEKDNDYTVFLTRSTDGGYTWSEMEPTYIPGSPAHLLKHSSGKLVCVVGCRLEEDGYGIYAYVSEDDGKTFTSKYVINDKSPNYDLGYPASVELDDGSIVTVYYQRYYNENTGEYDDKPCIMCTRWTL
ncbi:MAG: exo-alpha-sialidase [Clostridiales bacterium]|nr:exo-alpha-sialidase [Clostridiales bacterium]